MELIWAHVSAWMPWKPCPFPFLSFLNIASRRAGPWCLWERLWTFPHHWFKMSKHAYIYIYVYYNMLCYYIMSYIYICYTYTYVRIRPWITLYVAFRSHELFPRTGSFCSKDDGVGPAVPVLMRRWSHWNRTSRWSSISKQISKSLWVRTRNFNQRLAET